MILIAVVAAIEVMMRISSSGFILILTAAASNNEQQNLSETKEDELSLGKRCLAPLNQNALALLLRGSYCIVSNRSEPVYICGLCLVRGQVLPRDCLWCVGTMCRVYSPLQLLESYGDFF